MAAGNAGQAPSFDISRKKNDALKIFKGGLDDYELWHDRLVDHIARGHPLWRQVLAFVEQQTMKIRYLDIVKLDIVGINAWDLAMGLENFVVDFVTDTCTRSESSYAAVSQTTALSCGAGYSLTTEAEAQLSRRVALTPFTTSPNATR